MVPNLCARRVRPERMDEPDLRTDEHYAALRGLGRINWLSRSHVPIWRAMHGVSALQIHKTLHVLDVACGSGDIVIRLAKHAEREGLPYQFHGLDRSETAVRMARDRA